MADNANGEAIDSLARFLDQHTFLPEEDCRALIRDAAAGLPITLPDAGDFAGEVLRAKLATIFSALASEPTSATAEVKQNVPANTAPSAPSPAASLPEMTGDARAAAIRAMAGPDLAAVAEALIATSATMSDAHTVFMIARAQVAASAPPKYLSVAERHASQVEIGGSFEPRMSRSETANAGWKKAFASAERSSI